MGKRKDPPKKIDPPKRMDPPKGVGGEGHSVLAALESGSADPPESGGGRGHQVLAAMESGSVGRGTHPDPLRAERITVGTAKRIIGPAHQVLIGLSIPNDLSEAHRDLFLELLRSIEDLRQSLADLRDENRPLSDEPEEFRMKLDDALPLWKEAWETFVLKAAEGAGTSVGKGAVFTAGFIAGMTYNAFAAEAPGLSI